MDEENSSGEEDIVSELKSAGSYKVRWTPRHSLFTIWEDCQGVRRIVLCSLHEPCNL